MKLADIVIGERHRKDMGDIATLARSMDEIGLLHPVVVRPDSTLIAGERRIRAAQMLGWKEIPSRVVDLDAVARGEHDENALRKDFTPSEAVAIGRALEPMEREAAKERMIDAHSSESFSGLDKGNALDRVASTVGMSRPTFVKAQEIVEAAEREPERYAPLVEQMDRTGNVHGAFKELQRARKQEAKQTLPDDLPAPDERSRLFCGRLEDVGGELGADSADIIITDPP